MQVAIDLDNSDEPTRVAIDFDRSPDGDELVLRISRTRAKHLPLLERPVIDVPGEEITNVVELRGRGR